MSTQQLPPTNTFFISIDTKSSGYITGVKVTIEEDVIDLDETVRIDLADHPLYAQLQGYVRSNPR
jgi:hypothetical protein